MIVTVRKGVRLDIWNVKKGTAESTNATPENAVDVIAETIQDALGDKYNQSLATMRGFFFVV